jgi:hypothetical protein
MTYAESMILGYTVLVGVTLGSLLVIRLLWKTDELALSQIVQTTRRS